MQVLVRPELPTASVGSSQATTAAVDNSAPLATRPQSTYKSGNVVQTSGATSITAMLVREMPAQSDALLSLVDDIDRASMKWVSAWAKGEK